MADLENNISSLINLMVIEYLVMLISLAGIAIYHWASMRKFNFEAEEFLSNKPNKNEQ